MNGVELVIVLGFIFGLWVIWYFIEKKLKKNRKQSWKMLGERLGLEHQSDDSEVLMSLPVFDLFNRGKSKAFNNLLKGTHQGVPVLVVDYEFTEKALNPTNMTLCIISSDVSFPHFLLRSQKGWVEFIGVLLGGELPKLDDFGAVYGGKDTDFEDDPEFSKRFVLQGLDVPATTALFGASTRAVLNKVEREPLFCEGLDGDLIYYVDKQLDEGDVQAFMEEAIGLFKQLSEYSPPETLTAS